MIKESMQLSEHLFLKSVCYELSVKYNQKKYIFVIDQLNNLYLLVLMCKAALLSTIILILHAQAQILENFPPPPEKADAQSEGQLIRLRDVQLQGQSFAQTLKRLGPKLPANKQILSSKGARRLLVEDAVQNRINSFPPAPEVEWEDNQIGSEAGVFEGQACDFDIYSYSIPTNEFLHYDFSYSNIFPGSVLKSSYLKGVLDGTQSQQPIPASFDLKNPSISIIDQSNFNTFTQIYSFRNISQAINRSIGLSAPQNKDNTIFFQMDTTDNLADFSRRMSFNVGLLKKLGIQSPDGSPYNRYQKKIIFLFTKPLGTFDAVIKSFHQDLQDTPLNTFYSPNLTLKVFDSKTPSWWGPKSPPAYIDSVIYGSIVVMTVNYNKITANLMKKLEEEAMNGPQAAQKVINLIVSQPNLKIFSRGPFSIIELAKWKKLFLRLPEDISNRVIQPYLYTVKDFKEDRYNVANQYKYVKVCASPPPLITYKILVKLQQVLNQAPVIMILKALSGQVILKLNFYSATVFDLTPYLNDPQMIVIIRPTVSCSCPSSRQQVKAGFIVNNVYTHKLSISCAGNCYENDAGTYSVKKDMGQISP